MSNVVMSRRGRSGRIFTQKPNTPLLDFGPWEGYVYTFNQSGDIIKTEFEPEV